MRRNFSKRPKLLFVPISFLGAWITLVWSLTPPISAQTPLGSAFTYQGELRQAGLPAEGFFDFEFKLFDASQAGAQVGAPLAIEDVSVAAGTFSVLLDFGSAAFEGSARWLEIGVRPGNSTDPYTLLQPRQPLTPAPYTLHAATTDNLGGGLATTDRAGRVLRLNNTRLEARDGSSNPRATFEVFERGEGGVITIGPNNETNTMLTSLGDNPNHGYVAAADERGVTQAALFVLEGGEGGVSLWGPDDSLNVDISATAGDGDLGFIGVADQRGEIQSALSIFSSGEGGLTLWGPNDSVNVDISALVDNSNHGFIGVADATGSTRAGAYVDENGDGVLFSDLTLSVLPHPKRADAEIVYADLKGPEGAIFCRGVATLVQGRALITPPEHFQSLAQPDSMTVQLTPASFNSRGVAFEFAPDGALDIRELNGGLGEYDVHYVIHARRASAKNFEPVRLKTSVAGESRGVIPARARAVGAAEKSRRPSRR